ncbi:hypothetical protein BJ875DRAFT_397679 [Amylocarpus encephaloides]|uniref:Tyrosine specific protein phosphatases domain-containing protein n=1 Tax=Amylocarpus encephaloides TaxID=45428 RepID=A0A9P8C6X2_9HELO|nr:hypothetical protein BJ875DRAFT_397679 [Amylocarpus encephaloides]
MHDSNHPEWHNDPCPSNTRSTTSLSSADDGRAPLPFIPKAQADVATISQQIGVRPAAGSFWRPPSPPHVHVPAAIDEIPVQIPPYNGIAKSEEEQQILRLAAPGDICAVQRDWKYEYRREAQAVLPHLYLGPSSAARDVVYLQREKITLLLAIRNTASARARLLSGEKAANQLGIQAAAVDVQGNQQLIAAFPTAIGLINEHIVAMYKAYRSGVSPIKGKVLVFCESGNERSSCIVAAYIMQMYSLGLVPTIQYVQLRRFCVAFDDSLKGLLFSFCGILEARLGVLAAKTTTPLPCSLRLAPPPKRSRDDTNDGEMDFGMEDDIARFDNRAAFVPFIDRS